MLMSTRRGHWLLALGAVGVLGTVTALTLRSDPAAAPSAARVLVPLPVQSPLPVELPATNAVERKSYIVQAESAAAARSAVQRSGGAVTADLEVIRAVGATLNGRELSALRHQRNAHLQIYDDTAVRASSAAAALPETYYPSEIDASQLHIGGVTGGGVTVAVVDSGLWNNQGPCSLRPPAARAACWRSTMSSWRGNSPDTTSLPCSRTTAATSATFTAMVRT